jgi:hypothetical protein
VPHDARSTHHPVPTSRIPIGRRPGKWRHSLSDRRWSVTFRPIIRTAESIPFQGGSFMHHSVDMRVVGRPGRSLRVRGIDRGHLRPCATLTPATTVARRGCGGSRKDRRSSGGEGNADRAGGGTLADKAERQWPGSAASAAGPGSHRAMNWRQAERWAWWAPSPRRRINRSAAGDFHRFGGVRGALWARG